MQQINKNHLSAKNPLVVIGFAEPSLVFYLNTKDVLFVESGDAASIVQNNPGSMLLLDQENFKQIVENKPQFALLDRTKGYNYSKGKWVELYLVRYNYYPI
ncbi:hypothetical protein COY90_05320 [Candidatus Roizmanbacteria bacterium CG_4_10_14_0_8_um_filter_39_9]|uniref:Uncharacterized protein n=1 Tax=Candidatus Roizmanbacteria bacterium CG_4_10_14_0_8_um_filter_39_9 TaxID=1974829 RepID=A0A2M7QCG3_9BACT|nr:MAG: hypothetical protein COY90_05320 [Candidatus Roizmanbacteria bacterium CG_4_10_14_0_8_um_filter_39_9]